MFTSSSFSKWRPTTDRGWCEIPQVVKGTSEKASGYPSVGRVGSLAEGGSPIAPTPLVAGPFTKVEPTAGPSFSGGK